MILNKSDLQYYYSPEEPTLYFNAMLSNTEVYDGVILDILEKEELHNLLEVAPVTGARVGIRTPMNWPQSGHVLRCAGVRLPSPTVQPPPREKWKSCSERASLAKP